MFIEGDSIVTLKEIDKIPGEYIFWIKLLCLSMCLSANLLSKSANLSISANFDVVFLQYLASLPLYSLVSTNFKYGKMLNLLDLKRQYDVIKTPESSNRRINFLLSQKKKRFQ